MQTPPQIRTHFVVRVLLTFTALCLMVAALSVTLAAQTVPSSRMAALVLEARRASTRTTELPAPAELRREGREARGGLLIPVLGITAERLRNTYDDARSGGRRHDAIDIHAPRGTPVVATTDGTIIKLHSGARGGLSLYQMDPDGRTRYYYAHLDRYAEGVREGLPVRRGQVIGYVGDTGNATPGDYHLHFSIAVLGDRSRWWSGDNLNPFHILRRSYERVTGQSSSTRDK